MTEDTRIMSDEEMDRGDAETAARIDAARARPRDPALEQRVADALRSADAYPMRVWREPEGYFAAEAPDVPNCIGTGTNPPEALADWRAAFAAVAEATLAAGDTLPEPSPPAAVPTHSGRFVVRVPRSLHARLAEQAAGEGISLNQLALAYLAEGLGRRAS
jgi:antitoxin HicB